MSNHIQTNPNTGEIALKYYQPQNRILVQKTPSHTDYVFICKANITMGWVKPEDVDNLLNRRAGCNCGGSKRQQAFVYANESDVRRWTNGGGR